jgi:spore germination protein GerM
VIPRHLTITLGLLLIAALGTSAYVFVLSRHRHVAPEQQAELQAPVTPPAAGPPEQVTLFVADDEQGTLQPRDISINLPSDPTQRAHAVLRALLASYMDSSSHHTIAPGSEINNIFLIQSGAAVVDLSAPFANRHRSGVLVEELTVLSLVRTLAANFPGIRQVKILIDGKERDTLAGHADLADFYDVVAVNQLVDSMRPSK